MRFNNAKKLVKTPWTYEKGVSVVVMCYNHEKFISRCLQSIIEQQLDCQIEIIVVDDCSEDNSRQILEQLKVAYPLNLKLIFNNYNKHSKGEVTPLDALKSIKTEYVAFCDGDDYWTDRKKLQKQIEVTRVNKRVSLVHTNYKKAIAKNGVQLLIELTSSELEKARKVVSATQLISGNDIKHSTVLIRRDSLDIDFIANSRGVLARDWLIAISSLSRGSAVFLPDITTIHQVHDQGVWNSKNRVEMDSMKEEVILYCAKNLNTKSLRSRFRRRKRAMIMRRMVRSSKIYPRVRPMVKKFRVRKHAMRRISVTKVKKY